MKGFLLGVILAMTFQSASGQSLQNDGVLVEVLDAGATSELLDTPVSVSPALSRADLSMKYFGPQSESDISVVLTLYGAKSIYDGDRSFGAKFFAGDTPLSQTKFRLVERTNREDNKLYIVLRLTEVEIAQLSAENTFKIELYDVDINQKIETFGLTSGGMRRLKSFAKSIVLIRSHLK